MGVGPTQSGPTPLRPLRSSCPGAAKTRALQPQAPAQAPPRRSHPHIHPHLVVGVHGVAGVRCGQPRHLLPVARQPRPPPTFVVQPVLPSSHRRTDVEGRTPHSPPPTVERRDLPVDRQGGARRPPGTMRGGRTIHRTRRWTASDNSDDALSVTVAAHAPVTVTTRGSHAPVTVIMPNRPSTTPTTTGSDGSSASRPYAACRTRARN